MPIIPFSQNLAMGAGSVEQPVVTGPIEGAKSLMLLFLGRVVTAGVLLQHLLKGLLP